MRALSLQSRMEPRLPSKSSLLQHEGERSSCTLPSLTFCQELCANNPRRFTWHIGLTYDMT